MEGDNLLSNVGNPLFANVANFLGPFSGNFKTRGDSPYCLLLSLPPFSGKTGQLLKKGDFIFTLFYFSFTFLHFSSIIIKLVFIYELHFNKNLYPCRPWWDCLVYKPDVGICFGSVILGNLNRSGMALVRVY